MRASAKPGCSRRRRVKVNKWFRLPSARRHVMKYGQHEALGFIGKSCQAAPISRFSGRGSTSRPGVTLGGFF